MLCLFKLIKITKKKYRNPKILAIQHQNLDQDFGFENFLNLVTNTVPTFVKYFKRIDDELSSILQAIEINHSQAVKLCNKIHAKNYKDCNKIAKKYIATVRPQGLALS